MRPEIAKSFKNSSLGKSETCSEAGVPGLRVTSHAPAQRAAHYDGCDPALRDPSPPSAESTGPREFRAPISRTGASKLRDKMCSEAPGIRGLLLSKHVLSSDFQKTDASVLGEGRSHDFGRARTSAEPGISRRNSGAWRPEFLAPAGRRGCSARCRWSKQAPLDVAPILSTRPVTTPRFRTPTVPGTSCTI